MNGKAILRRRTSTPGSTGMSFRDELRELLLERLKLAGITGFVISALTWVFEHAILMPDAAGAGHSTSAAVLHLAFPAGFGLTTLALYLRDWSARQLRVIDYSLISFAIVVVSLLTALHAPGEAPLFGLALLLFIHAAFIPVPVGYQVGLAVTAVLAYPAAVWSATALAAASGSGGAGAWDPLGRDLVQGTFMISILGAVSILITKTLYNMRRSLRQAQRLGNYIIQEEIGRGGMGAVYVATHALMCRPTAVKVLRGEDGDASTLGRFEREVRLSSTLTHPNTITIFDFGRTKEGTFYYAMEYLQGMDLQKLVEHFGPIPAERCVYILIQACGSLAEAHARGIVHRDIKPSNLFLTRRGDLHDFVKVLDFGLAKRISMDALSDITRSGVMIGTPRYFAPESVHGPDSLDARADIYNLGGVAYWMLTGQPPFESESPLEVIVDHVKTAPRRPSEISELPIPRELDDIVMRCLEKRPQDRFQCVADLRAALRGLELERPWNEDKARDWWRLHVPADALDVECIDYTERMPVPVDLSSAGSPLASV